ncbi:unnamed protein product [Amoebophrya sp. A25]|nr:unnamed protein product [Amoebophrya sp. A25]|eukprot:GSA25T00013173001.1
MAGRSSACDAISQAELGAVSNYRNVFGDSESTVYLGQAPGRIEILGNHTDYNDGFVLSAGVQMQCRVVGEFLADPGQVSKRGLKPDRLRIYSASFPETGIAECSLSSALESTASSFSSLNLPSYCVYICGVLVNFMPQGSEIWKNNMAVLVCNSAALRDLKDSVLQLYIESEVPLGAAVSSSAALEVATATFLQQIFPSVKAMAPLDVILSCKRAENEYVGMGCGILDQFSSHQAVKDSLLLLDCRYPMEKLKKVAAAGRLSFVLGNTGVKHALVDGQYDTLKRLCYEARDDMIAARNMESGIHDYNVNAIPVHLRDFSSKDFEELKGSIRSDDARRRGQHVIEENERVLVATKLLLDASKGDDIGFLQEFGALMCASHASSKNLFGNSCPELDQMVDFAKECPGHLGARLMGGGFGGCTITLVKPGSEAEFSQALADKWKEKYGREPAICCVKPGSGAKGMTF